MNQAEKDCLALWEYMAETGCRDKREAIGVLFDKRSISSSIYINACPLCGEFYLQVCDGCPWPGYGCLRCLNGGPYVAWGRNRGKQSAEAVYQYIKKFLEDKYAGSGKTEG